MTFRTRRSGVIDDPQVEHLGTFTEITIPPMP